MPARADYADLADRHEKLWLDRARQAVRLAVREAGEHPGRMVPVDIDKVSASVAQDWRSVVMFTTNRLRTAMAEVRSVLGPANEPLVDEEGFPHSKSATSATSCARSTTS